MRSRNNNIIYRYLIVTLVVCCLGITFLIYSNNNDNKNFVRNPIDKNKSWYQFFVNGVKNISSTTFEENITTMKDNVQKGINLLEVAKLRNTDTLVDDLVDKNITIGKSINQITDTLYCVQYIKNIAVSYLDIIGKYNVLSQKFVELNKVITDKLASGLNDESTKSCYLNYIQNIKSISDDMVGGYNQVSKTKGYIDGLIEENYKSEQCVNIQDKYNDLSKLSSDLSGYIETINLVISRVNSDKIEDNKSLCNFGTIVGMTGIESRIYKINNSIKGTTGDNTITDINNYEQYVQKVKDKTQQYLDILDQLFKK